MKSKQERRKSQFSGPRKKGERKKIEKTWESDVIPREKNTV